MRSPKFRLLGLAVAPLILLSACGDGNGSDETSSTASADDAAATSMAPTGTADDVTLTEADADRTVLWEGLVLAIEPFLTTGATWAHEARDGWTLRTPGHLSAQFEHTVIVTKGAPIVLTA